MMSPPGSGTGVGTGSGVGGVTGGVTALVGSAVSVAFSVHHSRLKLQALQKLDEERNQLDVEWGQLLLEQHAWGSYGRIGKLGAEELQMLPPPPQTVVMVQQ